MELFDPFKDGLTQLLRYSHYLAGVTWIGILYYFNFVQVPAYAQLSAPARSEALKENTFRALWWFRVGAMVTVASGILIIGLNSGDGTGTGPAYKFDNGSGVSIFTGGLMGIVMFVNVMAVIWPNQKIVLANAAAVLEGREADPAAPAAARRAFMASRTNTFLSFPMLWFMAFTSHFAGKWGSDIGGGKLAVYWILILAFVALTELVALGMVGGGFDVGGPLHYHLEQHKNTIIAGLVSVLVIHVVLWELILNP